MQSLFPHSKLLHIQAIEKGFEHAISILTFEDQSKLIFRRCKFSTDASHFPFLNYVSQLLLKYQLPVASILEFTGEYCVESLLPGVDVSDLPEIWNSLTKKQFNQFCQQLASHLVSLHSISCQQFGNLDKFQTVSQQKCIGSDTHWIHTFDPSFLYLVNKFIKTKSSFFSTKIATDLKQLYSTVKPILLQFNTPVLLHGDLNANNIRVELQEDHLHICGIVDFGDVKAGDYRFDLGRLLCHWKGDWNKMNLLCEYYYNKASMQKDDVQLIQFYAIYYTLLLIDCMNNDDKYSSILQTLLQDVIR